MRIGLVTDTHLPSTIRDLWDEVRVTFSGADLILHAGDIVSPRVLEVGSNRTDAGGSGQ